LFVFFCPSPPSFLAPPVLVHDKKAFFFHSFPDFHLFQIDAWLPPPFLPHTLPPPTRPRKPQHSLTPNGCNCPVPYAFHAPCAWKFNNRFLSPARNPNPIFIGEKGPLHPQNYFFWVCGFPHPACLDPLRSDPNTIPLKPAAYGVSCVVIDSLSHGGS